MIWVRSVAPATRRIVDDHECSAGHATTLLIAVVFSVVIGDTVNGDTVNGASRVERLMRTLSATAVISAELAKAARAEGGDVAEHVRRSADTSGAKKASRSCASGPATGLVK
jgi:hypothetical protein